MVHCQAVPDPSPATAAPGRAVDPRLLVVAAAALWGTTGTARALGPDAASPSAVGAARLVVGGACLLLAARSGLLAAARPGPARDRAGGEAARRRSALGLAVAAGAMAAYQPLFFGGVARTGVAVGTVVGIGSAPILAGVLGAVVRGERPGRRWWIATGLALTGTLLLVGTGGADDVDPAGIGLAVGAGLAYAVYVLASKLLLDAGWEADAVTVRVFAWAGLVLVPVAVAGLGPLLSPGGLLMVLHLGRAHGGRRLRPVRARAPRRRRGGRRHAHVGRARHRGHARRDRGRRAPRRVDRGGHRPRRRRAGRPHRAAPPLAPPPQVGAGTRSVP